MGVIVVVCAAFGLTVSEVKTKIMCLHTKGMSESTATFSVEAAGQVFNQTNEFVYLGRNVNHNADLSIEVNRRIRNAWCSFWKYTLKLYDRTIAPLELKIWMLRAEVLGTMLCSCIVWSPRACHYYTLRRAHHSSLTRCIGWRKNNRADDPIYLDTLIKTGNESIEATYAGGGSCSQNSWRACWRIRDCQVRDARRIGGARAAWGAMKNIGWGVSWTTSDFSASTPTCGRLQPSTRGNGAGRRNKGRNVSWRNGPLQRKQGWTTACNSMPKRDGKDQGEDSTKQAGCAGSLATVDPPGVCLH